LKRPKEEEEKKRRASVSRHNQKKNKRNKTKKGPVQKQKEINFSNAEKTADVKTKAGSQCTCKVGPSVNSAVGRKLKRNKRNKTQKKNVFFFLFLLGVGGTWNKSERQLTHLRVTTSRQKSKLRRSRRDDGALVLFAFLFSLFIPCRYLTVTSGRKNDSLRHSFGPVSAFSWLD
jgi:hypothetical protein